MRLILGEQAAYMLVWPQWRKSIASSITCTIVAAWFLRLEREEQIRWGDVIWLLVFVFAGTLTTPATMMAIPLEIGALSLAHLIRDRHIKPLFIGIIGGLPCVFQFVFYEIYQKGMLTEWLLQSKI